MLTIYQLVQDLATSSSYGRPTEFLHNTRILHIWSSLLEGRSFLGHSASIFTSMSMACVEQLQFDCSCKNNSADSWGHSLRTDRCWLILVCGEQNKTYLVGGLVAIFYCPIYWVANHPSWLSYFSEGWPNHQPDINRGPQLCMFTFLRRVSGMSFWRIDRLGTWCRVVDLNLDVISFYISDVVLEKWTINKMDMHIYINYNSITLLCTYVYIYTCHYCLIVHKDT